MLVSMCSAEVVRLCMLASFRVIKDRGAPMLKTSIRARDLACCAIAVFRVFSAVDIVSSGVLAGVK